MDILQLLEEIIKVRRDPVNTELEMFWKLQALQNIRLKSVTTIQNLDQASAI